MKVLLIDNYDSFTYNIVELLRQLHVDEISIYKNDEIDIATAQEFHKIIISPGPSTPQESGNILPIIKALAPTHSILGICLGHQAIAEVFGATLVNIYKPNHGFQTSINCVNTHSIFKNLPLQFTVGLYHSWIVESNNLPACLIPTSFTSSNQFLMSFKHESYDVHGIQFHPESYMTEFGKEILANWLRK